MTSAVGNPEGVSQYGAVETLVSVDTDGASDADSTDLLLANEMVHGQPASRFIDLPTAVLYDHAKRWRQLQESRKRYAQWELDPSCPGCRAHMEEKAKVLPASNHKDHCLVAALALAEERAVRQLTRALRAHPLWPWLSQFPGMGGGHVAFVISKIGDPRRFPGQRCTEGHYLPALYPVGTSCPVAESARANDLTGGDDPYAGDSQTEGENGNACAGTMLLPRPGTGTRSLWHWMGLAPGADGRSMRKRKGAQVSWDPIVRSSILMNDVGIKDQIVRQNVPVYGELYRAKKASLMARVIDPENAATVDAPASDATAGRGITSDTNGATDPQGVDERPFGRAGESAVNVTSGSAAETPYANDDPPGRMSQGATASSTGIADKVGRPLRQFEADRIARVYAVKQFWGDLLREWKRLADGDDAIGLRDSKS